MHSTIYTHCCWSAQYRTHTAVGLHSTVHIHTAVGVHSTVYTLCCWSAQYRIYTHCCWSAQYCIHTLLLACTVLYIHTLLLVCTVPYIHITIGMDSTVCTHCCWSALYRIYILLLLCTVPLSSRNFKLYRNATELVCSLVWYAVSHKSSNRSVIYQKHWCIFSAHQSKKPQTSLVMLCK